jgi:hypothetical protein
VLLSGLQFWAMHRQADYIRRGLRISNRQTRIASRNAKATKSSADALVDSQRAWLAPSDIHFIDQRPQDEPPVLPQFVFVLKNYGTTIARMAEHKSRFHTVKRMEDLPAIPEYRLSAKIADFPEYGVIVVPGEKTSPIRMFLEETFLTDEQVSAIHKQQLYLCAYFCIVYFDFANRRHEAQFCFIHRPGGLNRKRQFWLAGPPVPKDYNKHT